MDLQCMKEAIKEMQGQTNSGLNHVGPRGAVYDALFQLGDEENAVGANGAHEGTTSDYENISENARNSHLNEHNNIESVPEQNELKYLQQALFNDIAPLLRNMLGVLN